MAFDKIKQSQPHVVKLLENSLKKDRLSHAYLFEGELGTKKFETAIYFAQMLLCLNEESRPCLECKNCRRVQNHIHPNVYIIDSNNSMIKKQEIEELQYEFAKTAIEVGPKIYIIRNIENLNQFGSNSLLKFLEEPYPNIHAILTTSNINRILPTIISRSQIVSFHSINAKLIEEELIEQGFEGETSRILSNLTNSTDSAIEISNNEYYLDLVEFVKDIYQIIDNSSEPLVIYFTENNSIIYQDKEISILFLSLMIIYQKDVISYITENTKNIVFKDEINTIAGIVSRKTKNRLIEELEHMLRLQSRINNYINTRLAFENLLLELERR